MKVALVHDWLNGMRGGEKVLEILCDIFPDAPIYTLFCDKDKLSQKLRERKIHTSILQKYPLVKRYYRYYLPLYPYAVKHIDVSEYDLIVSVSHCIAKAVKKRSDALHICYCNTPMRYVWGFADQYFGTGIKRKIINSTLNKLQKWDYATSGNVDFYIANSYNIKKRIYRCYQREADKVIYPPCDTDYFSPSDDSADYYLLVSALVPYKKIDIAVEAFNVLGYPLKIIGTGPEEQKLHKKAKSNITFLGWQSDEEVRDHYRKCKAFIFPGEEDFGIVPLEAQACGRPVIAYGQGGVTETVIPHEKGYVPRDMSIKGESTGILFENQTVKSLIDAVELFKQVSNDFNKENMRKHALSFSRQRCMDELRSYIDDKIS
ncbi:MAG: glycosyltransferase [Candidatus Ancaeobacter aquaticus]|nr:glycosyltransferase [Candidatus Ancaeobacter aquaticus]